MYLSSMLLADPTRAPARVLMPVSNPPLQPLHLTPLAQIRRRRIPLPLPPSSPSSSSPPSSPSSLPRQTSSSIRSSNSSSRARHPRRRRPWLAARPTIDHSSPPSSPSSSSSLESSTSRGHGRDMEGAFPTSSTSRSSGRFLHHQQRLLRVSELRVLREGREGGREG